MQVGTRIKFRRSHQKDVVLTGQVVTVRNDDLFDVETEPDGKVAEVSTLETVHRSDVLELIELLPAGE